MHIVDVYFWDFCFPWGGVESLSVFHRELRRHGPFIGASGSPSLPKFEKSLVAGRTPGWVHSSGTSPRTTSPILVPRRGKVDTLPLVLRFRVTEWNESAFYPSSCDERTVTSLLLYLIINAPRTVFRIVYYTRIHKQFIDARESLSRGREIRGQNIRPFETFLARVAPPILSGDPDTAHRRLPLPGRAVRPSTSVDPLSSRPVRDSLFCAENVRITANFQRLHVPT